MMLSSMDVICFLTSAMWELKILEANMGDATGSPRSLNTAVWPGAALLVG